MWRPRYRPHCQRRRRLAHRRCDFVRRTMQATSKRCAAWSQTGRAASASKRNFKCTAVTSGCGYDAKTLVGKPVRADQDLDGGRVKRVIVPLRGTDWGGGVVFPCFVPLRGTHLGFDSLATLRAACTFGADNEGGFSSPVGAMEFRQG